MKKKHRKKEVVQVPRNLKECFRPKKGEEFSYLGNATYKLGRHGEVHGKNVCLLLFYRAMEKRCKPMLVSTSLLRVLRLLENRGSTTAGKIRHRLLGGNTIEWMGWRWDKFRIKGRFNKQIETLAKVTGREVEDASHAGWFI
jgi:hypothetical protein